MKFKDYYAVLGVDRDSGHDQIKNAYRKLARQYHPDVASEPEAEERFKEISEAYQTLSDPDKRQAYDELGRHRAGEDVQPSSEWERRYWQQGGPQEVDLADLFEQMGYRTAARSGRGAADFAIRGQDLEVSTELSLEQAAHGAEVSFTLSVPMQRPDGRIERQPQTGRIRVPAGVIDGERLRVPGRGGAGHGGGDAGDLYLTLHLEPHRLFRAVGHDLYLELPLAPWEAALGAEVSVPTLDGPVTVTVKPGVRSGQKLRISGKGLPRRRAGAGDLYGVIQIVMPPHCSERELELYRELREASAFQPRHHFDDVRPDGAATHG